MPLPTDEKLLALSEDLITGFQDLFGKHPGFRPNHARGVLLTGTFVPSPFAAALSSAPHFNRSSVPVTVRFSSATGLPLISDTDPDANPRSLSIRFHLGDRVHTDIISHSVDSFVAGTGEDFLELLRANIAFAREKYYGVHAYKFTDDSEDRKERFARYRLTPDAGVDHLDDATTKTKDSDYLFNEIKTRASQGPVSFQLWAQIAEDGDKVDDVTLTLNALVEDDAKEQKYIIYDPIPRLRASVYLLSGLRRRAAA
ncbi:hypothetical protein BS47DRAFT_1350603 [Hydnum rufescens UP504]|uniref:Catalase n=1 Tax=Hydnum rufescens UP504 TaxID=1448309 RepID=A0A9P6DRC8_9AGAM|nr:hypothetical protein BS47DRAFT_1350603 [Hydnum rufescens UP504]